MAELKPMEVIMRIDFSANNGVEVVAHAEKVQELVRCKDCVHYWKNHLKAEVDDAVAVCLASPRDDAFCSEGERRDDGEDGTDAG